MEFNGFLSRFGRTVELERITLPPLNFNSIFFFLRNLKVAKGLLSLIHYYHSAFTCNKNGK